MNGRAHQSRALVNLKESLPIVRMLPLRVCPGRLGLGELRLRLFLFNPHLVCTNLHDTAFLFDLGGKIGRRCDQLA